LANLAGQPIRGLVFGGKWLEFISLSQNQINVSTTLGDGSLLGWEIAN